MLEESNCILSPSPPKLHSSIFSTSSTHLQIAKHQFYNGKKENYNNGHTKHLGNYD
jgi:hypothetical protein